MGYTKIAYEVRKMRNVLNTEIGKRIRTQREALGFSRELLAEKIEISSRFLADIELGTKGMSFQTLIRLSETLHVSTDYLLIGKETAETDTLLHLIEEIDADYRPQLEQILLAYQSAIQSAESKKL